MEVMLHVGAAPGPGPWGVKVDVTLPQQDHNAMALLHAYAHEVQRKATAVVRQRGMTNSERGKAFRARRKKYEDDLEGTLDSLRRELADLEYLRNTRMKKLIVQPVTRSVGVSLDSVLRTSEEYFSLFERGSADVEPPIGQKRLLRDGNVEAMTSKQLAFLGSVMDPELRFGDLVGVEALIDQWRRYTRFHTGMSVTLEDMTVTGAPEAPVVIAHVRLRVRFSRETVKNLFPHVLHDNVLVQELINKEVVYKSITQLHFSADGRVVRYEADVAFVEALLEAGIGLDHITTLMEQAQIKDQCLLGEAKDETAPMELPLYCEEVGSEEVPTRLAPVPDKCSERLDLRYILSS
ncbi:TPA: hypothetical protein N0F65_006180 [Lagenidium giganteum]|uniref:Uncharacterized protein n=1 Tax=Lagenidium giganteum TaxID=4803 RepID=A0AAV2Z900_9STRA|nr:TPA: hypothetical protein N0F65_006180 [Lagenidium giganteum]